MPFGCGGLGDGRRSPKVARAKQFDRFDVEGVGQWQSHMPHCA
jgi:hypothetical protein